MNRTPAGELTTLPKTPSRTVKGHPPHVSSLVDFGAYGLRNEVVIGPRDKGFPGPAVALDGPDALRCFCLGARNLLRRYGHVNDTCIGIDEAHLCA